MRLAGTTDIDLISEPLGPDEDGRPVYLKEIWPEDEEIREAVAMSVTPEMFIKQYGNVWDGNEVWNQIPISGGEIYEWDERSTYIHEPPFFTELTEEIDPDPQCQRRSRPGESRRFDHNRSYLSGGIYLGGQSGSQLSAGQWR